VITPAAVDPRSTVLDSTVGMKVSAIPTKVIVLAACVKATPPKKPVIVAVPEVPFDQTETVSPKPAETDTPLALSAPPV